MTKKRKPLNGPAKRPRKFGTRAPSVAGPYEMGGEGFENPNTTTDAPPVPALRSQANRALMEDLKNLSEIRDNPKAIEMIDAITGGANASDGYFMASLSLAESQSTELLRRIKRELSEETNEVCHISAHVPGAKVVWKDASFDLLAACQYARSMKDLAENQAWAIVPRITTDIDGETYVRHYLEGLLWGASLSVSIDDRLREPIYKMTTSENPDPISIIKCTRDRKMISTAVRSMFCVSRSHYPRSDDAQARARSAHRLFHVRATALVSPLSKFDLGEGKLHMKASYDAARKRLPDRTTAKTSAAPKARRSRDIGWLMRVTGFEDFELPYLKR